MANSASDGLRCTVDWLDDPADTERCTSRGAVGSIPASIMRTISSAVSEPSFERLAVVERRDTTELELERRDTRDDDDEGDESSNEELADRCGAITVGATGRSS